MIRALTNRASSAPLRVVVLTVLIVGLPGRSWAEPDAKAILVSQPSTMSDAERDEQLVKAERAIMEGLSARAIGAFNNGVAPAKQQKSPAQPKPDMAKPVAPTTPLNPSTAAAAIAPQKPAVAPATTTELKPEKKEAIAPRPKAPAPEGSASHVASENERLKRDLDAKNERVSALERELELVRGQLYSAEVELSRISSIKDPNARASLKRYPAPTQVASATTSGTGESRAAPKAAPAAVTEPLPSADLQIATVSAPKVELRLGPGKEHSALMQVSKGARLAVEARKGEWYRVFAPNGQRAWVAASQVTFGGAPTDSSSTVRVRGYSRSLEDAAFQRIQSMTGEK